MLNNSSTISTSQMEARGIEPQRATEPTTPNAQVAHFQAHASLVQLIGRAFRALVAFGKGQIRHSRSLSNIPEFRDVDWCVRARLCRTDTPLTHAESTTPGLAVTCWPLKWLRRAVPFPSLTVWVVVLPSLCLLATACSEPIKPPPATSRHCVREMVAMYERRGPPDAVTVESWGVDSLGHRYEPGPNQFSAWIYGSSLEAFSWGPHPCEVFTR